MPICSFSANADGTTTVKSYPLTHNGHTHHFCSKPCRQIFWEDRDSEHMKTVIERLLAGQINPPDVPGILAWMGLTPDVMGDDAYKYKWAEDYLDRIKRAA